MQSRAQYSMIYGPVEPVHGPVAHVVEPCTTWSMDQYDMVQDVVNVVPRFSRMSPRLSSI